LKKIIEENQDQNQCQCGCSCDSDNSDKQNQQGEGESNQDDQQGDNSGNGSQGDSDNQGGTCPKCGKPKKQNALDNLKQMDDHSIWKESKGSEQLAKEIAGDIVNRAVQKSRGNLPSNIESILELLFEKPQINWREVTKRIVGNKKLNTKKVLYKTNRRMPHRQELKGTIKDRTFELVVVVDESGSMSNDEINYGLNEIRAICKMQNSTVKVLHIDTEVKEISSFGKTDTVYKRSSCGGTYMYPAIEYMTEHKIKHDAIIFITDGEIENVDDWEIQPNKPIIFLTTNRMIESSNPRYRCFKLDYKMGV
jgi:predicted metal-dependent peptidase